MKKNYFKLFFALFMLITLSAFVYAQKNILYIGGGGTKEGYMMDQDCVDSIESWGYTVAYMSHTNYASAAADVYTGHDGVFMSETVSSGNMNNFGVRDNYPLPVVNTEGYTPRSDRWGWLTDNATEFHQSGDAQGTDDDRVIIIEDNTHYITSIFDIGEEVTWSDATGEDVKSVTAVSVKEVNKTYSSKLARNKAIASEFDFYTMIAIDEYTDIDITNRLFSWGMIAQGLNGDSRTENYGTQDFFTIIKRALEWTLDLMPSSVYDHKPDDLRLVTFPNPASDRATIRFHAPGSANATITLHNITGQQLELLYHKNTVDGNNFIFLDATKYAPGIYLVRLKIGENTQFTRLVIN